MRNDDVIPKWGHLRLRGGGEGRQILQGLPRIMDGGMLFLVVNLGVNQVHGFFGHFFWPVLGGLKIGRAQKKCRGGVRKSKSGFKKYNHAAYLVSECGGLL